MTARRNAARIALVVLALAAGAHALPMPTHAAPASRRPIVALDAPSNLGLRPPAPGVEPGAGKLPEALRRQGLLVRLGARDGGRVEPPAYSPDPDPEVGFRNGRALARYTRTLAGHVGALHDEGAFVLVLGGDCSILLGPMLALRQHGRYGLAFIDGHDDYSYVRDRGRYAGLFTAAGLDLGLATGHGPRVLVDLDGLRPYVREDDVVQLGLARAAGDGITNAVETFEQSDIHTIAIGAIREQGAAHAGRQARERLDARPIAGYWIHVDADVLDASIMPAVDSPNPRGLRFEELTALLAELLRSDKAIGLELTILDPDLDPDGRYAARFVDAVVAAFAHSGRIARARADAAIGPEPPP